MWPGEFLQQKEKKKKTRRNQNSLSGHHQHKEGSFQRQVGGLLPWVQQVLTHFQKLMSSQGQDVGVKSAKGRCWPHGGEPRNHM